MAKILYILNLLSFIFHNAAVDGRSLTLPERDSYKNEAVREMMSLLEVRKTLNGLEESTRPLTSVSSVVDEHNVGFVSHIQLCSDAVNYLTTGSETTDKRDLVINYVYNYCVRPSSSNDDILQFIDDLMGSLTESDDWINWPGFTSKTTTGPPETTVDYWQQLFESIHIPKIPSTPSWWDSFLDDLYEVEESPKTTLTTTIIPAASSTDYFDVDVALGEFWSMIEGLGVTLPAPSYTAQFDVDLQAFMDMLAAYDVTSQQATTQELKTPAVNAILNIFEKPLPYDNDHDVHNNGDNKLPPDDGSMKLDYEMRLLNLLADFLVNSRRQMRK